MNFTIKISKKIKFLIVYVFLLTCSIIFLNLFSLNFKYNGEPLWSESIYMVDKETGFVVFEKNSNIKRPIASINKIMSFLVVYKNFKNLDQKVKVLKSSLDGLDPSGSFCGIRVNEEFSIYELLNGLMMTSGNDCAQVLSDFLSSKLGTDFTEQMNITARNLGCMNTYFSSSHGNDNESFSTARDVTRFMSYAIKIPLFIEIIQKMSFDMFPKGDKRNPIVCGSEIMIPKEKDFYFKYVKGGKTGSKINSGRCFTSYAQKNNESYILTTLGAPVKSNGKGKNFKWMSPNYSFYDAKNLYEWIFSKI